MSPPPGENPPSHSAAALAHLTQGNEHCSRGQFAQGAAEYQRAIALRPDYAEAHNNLGNALRELGQLNESISAYQRALSIAPANASALGNLSITLRDVGRIDESVAAARQAVALAANSAQAQNNLGVALNAAQRHDEAIIALRRAVELEPSFAKAWNNLGNALREVRSYDLAIDAFRRALTEQPNYPVAMNGLGLTLKAANRLDSAAEVFRQAIAAHPSYADAHHNLGLTLSAQGRQEEALAMIWRGLSFISASGQRTPHLAQRHSDLASVLREADRIDAAIAACRHAIAIDPNLAGAHWNLSHVLLLKGNLTEGFAEHEWRFRVPASRVRPRDFSQPRWDGSSLTGRTILLHAEQGFGDTIQFVRYLPMVKAVGGRVLLECQPALVGLMQSSQLADQVIAVGGPLPDFDLHCPLLSLPHIFKTTLATIPATVPYLKPDESRLKDWRSRVPQDRMNVGLIWSGNPNQANDRNRSMSLDQLAPFAQIKGIRFHSLQKGPRAEQIKNPPPGMDLIDHSANLRDFADTAALMCALDLIITTDTAPAHLAGALARPTWLMLSTVADWRWLLNTNESPWYPTMKLFRQSSSAAAEEGSNEGPNPPANKSNRPPQSPWSKTIQQVADVLATHASNFLLDRRDDRGPGRGKSL